MKAAVVHQYGAPDVLSFEDRPDPIPDDRQVLVRVAATSVNPIDFKRRSGALKAVFPIVFPGILGVDVSGTVEKLGPNVRGFAVGDKVFCFADQTYAELCVVPAAALVKVPAGLDLVDAAALPLVTTTGFLLISETRVVAGQTLLVAGAVGNVGRSAVYSAKARGARVIAAVRGNQKAAAAALGADQVVAVEDETAIGALSGLDAVADTVGGPLAQKLLAKVKKGGIFASVVPLPSDQSASVKLVSVGSRPDASILQEMGEAAATGKLIIPIAGRYPLKDAAKAHAAVEAGNTGKVLLVP